MPLFSSDRCSDPGLSFPKDPCSVLGSNPVFDTEDNIYCSGRKLIFFSTPTWTDLVGFSLEEEECSKVPLKIKIDFTFYSFAVKPWAEVQFAVIIIVF